MMFLALYVGLGLGLAVTLLAHPSFRRTIDRLAVSMGISVIYGRTVWIGGTAFAWPIGLYVMATGRLVAAEATSQAPDTALTIDVSNAENLEDLYVQPEGTTIAALSARPIAKMKDNVTDHAALR